MGVMKRLYIVLGIVTIPLLLTLLFSYDVIKIEWVTFMAIQSSFKPQRDPLPVPEQSIPVQGAANIAQLGVPTNPVEANADSIKRGKANYENTCVICHGRKADGKGTVTVYLTQKKPVSLLEGRPLTLSDGDLFMTITNGVPGGMMPHVRENLPQPNMRWDVVNYVRSLQQAKK
jgi:mono/diheme cytochrome c family protein